MTSPESLCKGYPVELETFLKYTRALKFEEKPDYTYLKALIRELMKKNSYEYDHVYDWNVKDKDGKNLLEQSKEKEDKKIQNEEEEQKANNNK